MEDEDKAGAELLGRTTAAIAIAGLAAYKPELSVMVAGLVPLADATVGKLVERVGRDRRARALRVVAEASQHSDLNAQEFIERLGNEPRLAEVATKVILAAQDSAYEEKLTALSRCLAAAGDDLALVDEQLLLVAVIDQLEAPHVRLLKQFEDAQDAASRKWLSLEEVARHDPGISRVVDPLMGVLTRNGLVVEQPATGIRVGGSTPYVISEFGRYLVALLASGGPRG